MNRWKGETGYCGSGPHAKIASVNLHFGEEPPISGTRGSGTIFFSGCTLKCVFCQNYPISHLYNGNEVTDAELAEQMLDLQRQGAHNINLVTPTHMLPAILRALIIAKDKSLAIPIIYNSSGYERAETLDLLHDVVDIYMPDAKYATADTARIYSDAPDYPVHNRTALKNMFMQKKDLVLDNSGIAVRGLMVRHLVLPHHLDETEKILAFLKNEISPHIYVSLMAQYHPAFKADAFTNLKFPLTKDEYRKALRCAERLNLTNGWRQDCDDN